MTQQINHKIVFHAVEPLFKDRGKPQTEYRTHEHWLSIEKVGNEFIYSFGDERGGIEDATNGDLDCLLALAQEKINQYDMTIVTDMTNDFEEVKKRGFVFR